jgi:hypothetical protein
MAALVCRHFTSGTLAELPVAFGLGHPDSAANLVRRAKRRESASPQYRSRLKKIEQAMMKTEKQDENRKTSLTSLTRKSDPSIAPQSPLNRCGFFRLR